MLAFLALLGAPYIYDISSLRVNEDLKYNELRSKAFKYCGRWLNALITDIHGTFLNFVKLDHAG